MSGRIEFQFSAAVIQAEESPVHTWNLAFQACAYINQCVGGTEMIGAAENAKG